MCFQLFIAEILIPLYTLIDMEKMQVGIDTKELYVPP